MSKVNHTGFFFHSPQFVFRNTDAEVITFSNRKASIFFSRNQDKLISLERSSFGGPVADSSVSVNDLDELLKQVDMWSIQNHISTIQVRCFPEAYNTLLSDHINQAFKSNEYDVLYNDVDQVLPVIADHMTTLNASRALHVRRGHALGFQLVRLDQTQIKTAYDLAAETRTRKGYPMSMDAEDFAATVRQFPDHYLLFGVQYDDKIIAAAVVIKVSEEIWYFFYWGDLADYRVHSPITFLVHEVYALAKSNGVKLLDFGTSSDKGVINPGVFFFKKALGGEITNRYTFIKQLNYAS